ncbi:MAG: cell division protein FtsK, partial [Gemmobacter sp.]|uniref:DNA translocase FtsK n=1 Tax=Gemmobacter sp. TaxID=1898957 RepID=UPI001A5138B1
AKAAAEAQAAPLRAGMALARSPAAAAAAEAVAAAIRAGAAKAQAAAGAQAPAPAMERPAPLGRPMPDPQAAEIPAGPETVVQPVLARAPAAAQPVKPVLRAEPRLAAPVKAPAAIVPAPVSAPVAASAPVAVPQDEDWMLPETEADWQEEADLAAYRPASPAPAFLRRGAVPAAEVYNEDWQPEDDAAEEDDLIAAPRLSASREMAAARVSAPLIAPEVKRGVVQHPLKKPVQPSARAAAEAQPRLRFEEQMAQAYELPPLSLLASASTVQRHTLSDEALEENARMLESVLDDYGVKGEIVSVRPGPVVTMYELEPAPGLKASRVIGLADDIARSMSALSARVSTVPGRSVIGIELPNATREKVVLREILAARDFGDSNMRLPLALGKDIGGDAVVANLAKMPHLLIAGTTGSGKSVAINTMILSLLYKLTPEECRLIMIDPKMLELSVYDGIPHLLSPVVTDPKKAVVALKWVVGEMEERYRKMSKMGVRNIDGYNGRVREALAAGELFKRTIQTGFDEDTGEPVFETEEFAPVALPYIVVIVDEMADLMMVAGKEIEACIQRLAQMARASGIHLIMATQRPSVDVITGTIKANFPTRISFQVTSKIDSRTILGEQGAEQLLGQGDMLYMGNGARITRIHGPFVSDEEVEEIVNHLKSFGPPQYMSGVVEGPEDDVAGDIDAVLGLNTGGNTEGEDALYDQAVAIVAKDRKCSTSYIQRKLGIGYNKAARLVEQMEQEGVVTTANHVGKREILIPEA